jgi:phage tail sheath protein FI
MATYSKPGVYVEETLTPNLPVAPTVADSTAAFIGLADRGPTEVVNNKVVGIPTLISSWTDFVNTFSFGSSLNTFSGAGLGKTVAATSSVYSTSSANYTLTVATTGLSVGMSVNGSGIEPTSMVTAIGTGTVTLSRPITATVNGSAVFTNNALKYGVKSYFDNGGASAYVLREVNTDASQATAVFRDSNGSISQTTATSVPWVIASDVPNSLITITATTGTPFASAITGNSVSISNVTATSAANFLNSGRWVIAGTASSGNVLNLVYKGAALDGGSVSVAGTSAMTITNAVASTAPTLTVTSKSHGAWGNNVWVSVTPNNSAGYFDLAVYYSTTASTSTSLTDANRVERFVKLSMDSADARYVMNNVTSDWIVVSDNGSTATGYNDLPAFTGAWSTSTTAANISSTGALTWNASGFDTSTVAAARLGVASTTNATLAGTVASDGTATPSPTTVTYPRLDQIDSPLIINYPGRTDADTIVKPLLAYAAGRTDSFVVIDTTTDTVANTLTAIASYNTNQNYGAAYYPNIVIADPASTTGGTKTIPAGGAVAALYTVTDSSRGVFKAPAGAQTRITSAVSVSSLTNDEFNAVGGTTPNLNVIRFVPGSGICIMGARTLKSNTSDVYVPVRRSLNYLSYNLKNITEFAVFEPNDANLWTQVNGVVTGFLDGFWRNGGLSGATAAQAFYVKCDGTINTPAVVAAGELRIEVGVALQRPAEFVIIKIGQIDGGATVTTSI